VRWNRPGACVIAVGIWAIFATLTAAACLSVAVRRGAERDEARGILGAAFEREDALTLELNETKAKLSRRKYPDSRLANVGRIVT
jgi:hypothetical protein